MMPDGRLKHDALLRRKVTVIDEVTALANRIIGPMLSTQPAGGLGPGTHCAACCYGTGLIITCEEDEAVRDAALLLHKAASRLYVEVARIGGERDGG